MTEPQSTASVERIQFARARKRADRAHVPLRMQLYFNRFERAQDGWSLNQVLKTYPMECEADVW